tara:strand:+ start:964 stop:1071 length:108 start_codon:yes stop_codon:yes gene_type:complete
MKQKHQSTKVGKGYGKIPKKLKGNTQKKLNFNLVV